VLADVAPGIYTLRADQIGADGKVTSRFETPFKRETLQALAAVAAPEVAPVVKSVSAVEPVAETAPLADPAAVAKAAPAPEAASTEVTEPAATAPAPVSAAEPAPVPVVQAEPAKPAPVSVTVQPGFTLWGIAQERFGDGVLYVQVFEANKDKIRDPDLIYPGQIFTIPTAP
jgi:nucleoid-associated protein YgaU